MFSTIEVDPQSFLVFMLIPSALNLTSVLLWRAILVDSWSSENAGITQAAFAFDVPIVSCIGILKELVVSQSPKVQKIDDHSRGFRTISLELLFNDWPWIVSLVTIGLRSVAWQHTVHFFFHDFSGSIGTTWVLGHLSLMHRCHLAACALQTYPVLSGVMMVSCRLMTPSPWLSV